MALSHTPFISFASVYCCDTCDVSWSLKEQRGSVVSLLLYVTHTLAPEEATTDPQTSSTSNCFATVLHAGKAKASQQSPWQPTGGTLPFGTFAPGISYA